MRVSKPVDHPARIAFSKEQGPISRGPLTHGSGGRKLLDYPTPEALSLPNSHGAGLHELHRSLWFEVAF
jgi:hypothetical protein